MSARNHFKLDAPLPFWNLHSEHRLKILGALYNMARQIPKDKWTFENFYNPPYGGRGEGYCLIGHAARRPRLARMLNLSCRDAATQTLTYIGPSGTEVEYDFIFGMEATEFASDRHPDQDHGSDFRGIRTNPHFANWLLCEPSYEEAFAYMEEHGIRNLVMLRLLYAGYLIDGHMEYSFLHKRGSSEQADRIMMQIEPKLRHILQGN